MPMVSPCDPADACNEKKIAAQRQQAALKERTSGSAKNNRGPMHRTIYPDNPTKVNEHLNDRKQAFGGQPCLKNQL